MTKLKDVALSDLPTFATIEDNRDERLYMRDSLGGWALVFPKDIHEADKYEIHPEDADAYFKDFAVRAVPYGWTRAKRSSLIWKDIPGFPNWQISNNGRVRNVGYNGYKQRTKDGDFILRRNGRIERWSETQLGTDEERIAFFAN